MRSAALRIATVIVGLGIVMPGVFAQESSKHDEVASGNGDLSSFDYRNEDIRTVLRDVADRFELNLVVPETLVGRTSVNLRNVTWRQMFDVVLTEQNYTYVEEGNVVRIVSRDSLSESSASGPVEPETPLDVVFRWNRVLIILALAVTTVCHFCLFIGVLVDSPPGKTRFVPKWIWALLMLFGGVTSAAGYWLIHYSKLRPACEGNERVGTHRESS